jgi:hypothetical protein
MTRRDNPQANTQEQFNRLIEPDRLYVYAPGRGFKGKPVVPGYSYSLLDWVPEAGESWSLSVDIERVSPDSSELLCIKLLQKKPRLGRPLQMFVSWLLGSQEGLVGVEIKEPLCRVAL